MTFYYSPFNAFLQPRSAPTHTMSGFPFVARPAYNESYDDDEEDDYDYDYNRYVGGQCRYPSQQQQAAIKEMQHRRQIELARQRQLELERQQRQQEVQRAYELKLKQERERQLLQHRQLLAQRQQEQERLLFRKKILLLRYTHAAKVIQRAFRIHSAARKTESVVVLQHAVRNYLAKQAAKEVTEKLRVLLGMKNQLEELRALHEAKVLSKPAFDSTAPAKANKEFLVYEDAILKLLIKLDGVNSGGHEIVRDTRKAVVARAQRLLSVLDQHKQQKEAEPAASEPVDMVTDAEEPTELRQEQQEEQQEEEADTELVERVESSPTESLMEVDHPNNSEDEDDEEEQEAETTQEDADSELVSTSPHWVVLPNPELLDS